MFNRIFKIQSRFGYQFNIVSQILLLYAELELALLNCVHMGRRGDLNTVLKAMFRQRRAEQRIETAKEMGRVAFSDLGLQELFDRAMIWMQHCREIRNQYAHAYWHDDETGWLCFVGLEELARREDEVHDLLGLTFYHLDEPLLREQELFFRYTEGLLAYLNYESRLLRQEITTNPNPLIGEVPLPPLHMQWPPRTAEFNLQSTQ